MRVFNDNGQQYVYLGSQSRLTQQVVNSSGIAGAQNNRTPAGFTIDLANLWQLDILFDLAATTNMVIAHAGQNLSMIDSSVERPIYYGPTTGAGPLVASAADPVSGGIVVLAPYLLSYGNAGQISVSPVNDPGGVTAGKL